MERKSLWAVVAQVAACAISQMPSSRNGMIAAAAQSLALRRNLGFRLPAE